MSSANVDNTFMGYTEKEMRNMLDRMIAEGKIVQLNVTLQ